MRLPHGHGESTVKLNPQPPRRDLTDRECANILGGLIGSLCTMANPEQVKAAVKWWAETNAAWEMFRATASYPPDAATRAIIAARDTTKQT